MTPQEDNNTSTTDATTTSTTTTSTRTPPQSPRRNISFRRPETRDNASNPSNVFQERIVVALVGLPARGKSYLSKTIVRYLNFLGCPTQLFNAGITRRNMGLAGSDANFFDPNNTDTATLREQIAMTTLQDLLDWLIVVPQGSGEGTTSRNDGRAAGGGGGGGGCRVGMFDATNTTKARRQNIVDTIHQYATERDPCLKLIFVESLISEDNHELLKQNYKMKLANDDYNGTDPKQALEDFRERVRQYESVYESIDDDENLTHIQLINAGEKLISKGIDGWVLRMIQRILGSIHLWPRTIWIALSGESKDDSQGIVGGDSELTQAGVEYTLGLSRLIRQRKQLKWNRSAVKHVESGHAKLVIYTGTHIRYRQMASIILTDHEREISRSTSALSMEGGNEGCDNAMIENMDSSTRGRNMGGGGGGGGEYRTTAHASMQLLMTPHCNNLCAGVCEGLSIEEIKEKYPCEIDRRREDKLNYRYPGVGGESYQDLVARANELLCMLEQAKENSLVICDRAIFRVLMGYFLGKNMEEVPFLKVRPGIVELSRNSDGFRQTQLDVSVGKSTESFGIGFDSVNG